MFTLPEDKFNELWDLLWKPQKDAITQMILYIKNYHEKPTNMSALVQMPTGSGKSGVIAVLSTYVKEVGLTLVLTPRKILRNQISEDIKGRFYNRIGFKIERIPKEVINVSKGSILDISASDDLDNFVIVMTFNMLSRIFREKKDLFNILSKKTSLLLVDEGHYEPADNWSQVTRDVNAPTILFTATPYRNDFNIFNIDLKNVFTFTFNSAVSGNYIRDIKVIERTPLKRSLSFYSRDLSTEVLRSPSDFVNDIIDFYEKEMGFSKSETNSPRIIIRCDNKYSIQNLAENFIAKGYSCVGIHENFKQTTSWKRKIVPKPEKTDAIVWIHQFKLIEGIDDHRFQILAIYDKIKNTRSLVQQIGRITRNPDPEKETNKETPPGYFLEHWRGFHSNLWEGFLKYDEALDVNGPVIFYFSNQDLVSKLIEIQPKMAYVLGRFCFPFNFKVKIDPKKDIKLPLRVVLLHKLESFIMKDFIAFIMKTYKEDNIEPEEYCEKIADLGVILSVRLKNSPFLMNHTFLEPNLFLTVIKEFEDIIAIYDSSGKSWMGYERLGIGHSIDVEKLKKLFRRGEDANLKTVSLLNSNIGTSAIRSRTITASSIEETVSGFDDYAQICTTAEGYSSGDKIRQYVGFSRGRISRYNRGNVLLSEYLDWLDELYYNVIIKPGRVLSVFSRYALEEKIPEDTKARNILLDIYEIKDIYYIDNGNIPEKEDKKLKFKDTCQKVALDEFELIANGEEIILSIKFDRGRNKYILNDLNSLFNKYTREDDAIDFPPSIIQYFNQSQSFIILPNSINSIYVKGQFYTPRMRIGKGLFNPENYDLKNAFFTDPKIGACKTEKGSEDWYTNHNDDWDPRSLLGIISHRCRETEIADLFGDPDIILCDDMGNEIADFILCYQTEDPRIIFIHAKANATTDHSVCKTSSLHDVCSQVVKNIGYLAMFNDLKPPNLKRWGEPWNSKGRIVSSKIVESNVGEDPDRLWAEIRNVINDPITTKEVWLFLGNILSRKYFEVQLGKENPNSFVITAAYLLHGTMSSVASVGAKFRIICNE
ncbi:hypothetical protein LCGC14_0496890 [marine sediment metagenome]|uniref:Helicase ATP-binding domain-containing protein n=1 Tax=marine sediment metagenome TaxID=412755 RepID=A0A0F9URX4_9ZZZZ|nr:DEAD/DEAH box helicase [archaeon]